VSTNGAVIDLKEISKQYQVGELSLPVLRDVSLTVTRGEIVALMGSSGSGKTTLLNIIGLLDRPNSGNYKLEGSEVSKLTSDQRALLRNKKLGFVFQSFNLLPRMSALENVLLPCSYSADRTDKSARARELLERVGLADRMNHDPARLSGGQQQRVALARALINNPSIVLADEPTGNLDSQTGLQILEIFSALRRDDGITIVIVTHEHDVGTHADRIIKLRDGIIET
jgi:ABC-type lipoprotein export system ATPase subunit